jgi:hypothetical protein
VDVQVDVVDRQRTVGVTLGHVLKHNFSHCLFLLALNRA